MGHVPVIVGHRQVNYTECPGNVLFGLLPAIRAAVATIGDPKIYTPTAAPAAFSPNGDGVRDSVTLQAGLSGDDAWTIALTNAAGGRGRSLHRQRREGERGLERARRRRRAAA